MVSKDDDLVSDVSRDRRHGVYSIQQLFRKT